MVTVLQERTEARFLVTSRLRPSWATARRVVYAEIDEIGQDALAMDAQESFAVLGRRADLEELREQARGWPAVLSLASGLEKASAPTDTVPQALHRYVAEELFQSVTVGERNQLVDLALLPSLSDESLLAHFGASGKEIVERARELGFISSTHRDEVHPLLREFLLSKLAEVASSDGRVREAIDECVRAECWDQALDLARRFGLLDVVHVILAASYKPLVRSGRLGSLARFSAELRTGPNLPPEEVDLIDAELALRDGAYPLALQLAARVQNHLPPNNPLKSRAAAIAGGAAFQLADYDVSERAFEDALCTAGDGVDINEALHGLTIAATYGERPSVEARIEALGELATGSRSPLNVARYAISVIARMRIGDGFREGPYFDDALRVLDQIEDPRARTSVLLTLSYALGLQCQYAQALPLAERMVDEIQSFGFEFARPHGQWNLAFVKLGMRRFHEAESLLQSIEATVQQRPLGHHAMNLAVLRARLLMQLARASEGLEYVRNDVEHRAAPSMHGEYLATRAVGQALTGDHKQALRSADLADATSISSEVRVLAEGARAIVNAERGNPDQAAKLVALAQQRQTWDPVVSCVRSSQTLANCLAADQKLRPVLSRLYGLSSDHAIARKAGIQSPTNGDPSAILTPREFEVLELMAQGFRNREIAEAFVLSESTVKIHVRHVLAKLGVRTRTQAVARYQGLR
jgi:ATP/maltotriose-dependent transcriptional regulator MalT